MFDDIYGGPAGTAAPAATYLAPLIAPAPTGVAATDTANLQALLNLSTLAAPRWIVLREGTYKTNAALTFPHAPGTVMTGFGRDVTIIEQQTDATPIIEFTVTDTHSITWVDFTLQYANQQTAAGARAVSYDRDGVSTTSYYHHRYDRVRVRRAYDSWAINNAAGNPVTVWDTRWQDCDHFQPHHDIWSLVPTGGGMPSLSMDGIGVYASGHAPTGRVIRAVGAEIVATRLDIEDWHEQMFTISGGAAATIERVHIERLVMDTSLSLATFTDPSVFKIGGVSIQGTATGSPGAFVLFQADDHAEVHVEGLAVNVTMAAGALDIFYTADGTGTFYTLGDVTLLGGTAPAAAGTGDAGTLSRIRALAPAPWLVQVNPCIAPPTTVVGTWATAVQTQQIGNGQLFNSTAAQNDAVTYDLIIAPGTWTFEVAFFQGSDHGIVTVALDDGAGTFTTLGTFDGYAAANAYNQLATFAGVAVAGQAPMRRRLRLTVTSKNASSSGYYASLSAVQCRRTA